MPLRIDFDDRGEGAQGLARELRRTPCPKGELWVVSLRPYDDGEGWLVVLTGGLHKDVDEWCFLAVEDRDDGRICTYAQVFSKGAQETDAIVQEVAAFLAAPALERSIAGEAPHS
jgi:hypothetical protein